MLFKILHPTLLLGFILGASQAQAQSFGMDPGSFSAYMYSYETRDDLEKAHEQIFGQSIEESLGKKEPGSAKLSFTPSTQKTDVASDLASTYPTNLRAEAKKTFTELLAGYKKIETQFEIPKNDLSGAVAALIAGSYMAHRQVAFPDQNFKPLVAQMQKILSRSPELAKAKDAEKQETYERLASLGMLMATTTEALRANPKHPKAKEIEANLKKAGSGYLEAFLGTKAARVQIGSEGLVLK